MTPSLRQSLVLGIALRVSLWSSVEVQSELRPLLVTPRNDPEHIQVPALAFVASSRPIVETVGRGSGLHCHWHTFALLCFSPARPFSQEGAFLSAIGQSPYASGACRSSPLLLRLSSWPPQTFDRWAARRGAGFAGPGQEQWWTSTVQWLWPRLLALMADVAAACFLFGAPLLIDALRRRQCCISDG